MSIVLKLQKKCLDKNEDLQSLLREALVISTKLKLNDFKKWINDELKGYDDYLSVPKYRKISSTLKFRNPYHGYIPAIIENEKLGNLLTQDNITQSVSELAQLYKADSNELRLTILPSIEKEIMDIFNTDFIPAKFIYTTQIYGIIEQVRNLLLEWTLKLEEDNILGNDDLIFSEIEKETAKNIHIENFNGVMGDIDRLGNMSTGKNTTNTYNENNISNEIDNLITEIKKLNLEDQDQVIINLEASKKDSEKAKSVLGGLLSRGSEVASIGSAIIGILSLLG